MLRLALLDLFRTDDHRRSRGRAFDVRRRPRRNGNRLAIRGLDAQLVRGGLQIDRRVDLAAAADDDQRRGQLRIRLDREPPFSVRTRRAALLHDRDLRTREGTAVRVDEPGGETENRKGEKKKETGQ